jgi:mono/diheme cytochrome c family protein
LLTGKNFVRASLLLAVGLGGCHPLPPSKPLAQLTPTETSGYVVFQARCAECHHPNSQRALHGPGLQGLFKLPYLPSGLPANDERVTATIQHGRNTMPAFGNVLDAEQIGDLLAYLHTL